MQAVAHARVVKIHIPKSANKKFTLFEHMRPDMSGIFTPLTQFNHPDFYGTPTVTAFRFASREKAQLCFIVSEVLSTKKEVELARLVLPMTWFPMNRVVTAVFPLAGKKKTPVIMMLVEVHLADDGSEPFDAPAGKLLVAPTWVIPEHMTAQSKAHLTNPAPPPEVVTPRAKLAVQKVATFWQALPPKTAAKSVQTLAKVRELKPSGDQETPEAAADGSVQCRELEIDEVPKPRRILCTF